MSRAKRIVHKNVAERSHFLGQLGVVLFLAFVHAAVFKQHHLASCHIDTVHPVGLERHIVAQQFGQSFGHGCQGIFGFEFALGGSTQMAGDHDGCARIECHLNARHRGADACVFGDVARIVLRHVQIGADENTLAFDLALLAQIRKTNDVHGNSLR